MLWRLVVKMLFKASVPLIAIAAVLTYGVYLRGGDPGVLWKTVADRSFGQIPRLFSGAKDSATHAVGALSREASDSADSGSGKRTEVFTWRDANGVTHFSSSRPTGVEASTVSVNPDTNVLAPVKTPVAATPAVSGRNAGFEVPRRAADTDDVANELGGRLPGVAGQVLSARSGNSQAASNAEPESAIDPLQLMRMLKSAGN
jgi:hypothetical protein